MPGLGLRVETLTPQGKDPRNANFPLAAIVETDESLLPNAATWLTSRKALDQGNTGTCVGHAGRGFLDHPPVVQVKPGQPPTQWDLYRGCVLRDWWTENDDEALLPDRHPGMDFGTSTLALLKTMQALGLIGEYRWAWDVETCSRFLRMQGPNFKDRLGGPIVVGSYWLESMFNPTREGILRVEPASGIAGGHEWLLKGANRSKAMFRMRNSWGTSWGLKGEAWISFEDFEWLLEHGGDAVTTNELKLA
jgi:hypothetical protein